MSKAEAIKIRTELKDELTVMQEINEALRNQLDDIRDVLREGRRWKMKRKYPLAGIL